MTLSNQDNAKLLQKLKSGFKRASNWNKYQWKIAAQTVSQYLGSLLDPSLQGEKILLFILSFENASDWTVHTKYFLPTVEIND